MKISAGAKKDLLIVGLCNALIVVSKTDETKRDEHLMKLDNTTHKINKKIDAKLDELQNKLSETQKQFYVESGSPRELGGWVRSKLNSKLFKVLQSLSKETNLESLANQILFNNFCERDKPVHDIFKWLSEPNQYNEIYDLLEKTKIGTITDAIYRDALQSISIIKQ